MPINFQNIQVIKMQKIIVFLIDYCSILNLWIILYALLFIVIIHQMASKQPLKLIDIKGKAIKLSLQLASFLKYSVFRQKKNILIIGEANSPILQQLNNSLMDKWNIFHLFQQKDEVLTLRINEIKNFGGNYKALQKDLEEEKWQQFQSIVVLPNDQSANSLNIEDERFISQYPLIHKNLTMKNILAYRLAHKYLSKTGIVILSCSQKDLLNRKDQEFSRFKKQENVIAPQRTYWDSHNIVNAQTAYLGVIIGDRSYTDLNSASIVALTNEISTQNPDIVTRYYNSWINQKNIPFPGSFARFRPKTEHTKEMYVEYL